MSFRCCITSNESLINENSISSKITDSNQDKVIRKKIVLVGDIYSGKTCLMMRKANLSNLQSFFEEYSETIFENIVLNVECEGQQVQLVIWDTSGTEIYKPLRFFSYKNCDAVVICYSVDTPISLQHIREKWISEVKFFCPNVPLVLVGNKIDVREQHFAMNDSDYEKEKGELEIKESKSSGRLSFVSYEEASLIAKEINAFRFLECSAKNNQNVTEVFQAIAEAALEKNKKNCKRMISFCKLL